MSHKNFRAINTNRDENFYGELIACPEDFRDGQTTIKINT